MNRQCTSRVDIGAAVIVTFLVGISGCIVWETRTPRASVAPMIELYDRATGFEGDCEILRESLPTFE